jgi:hypothetical protein
LRQNSLKSKFIAGKETTAKGRATKRKEYDETK